MRKYISEKIKEDYKNWKTGDLILIKAGTGSGKTYFVKNELNTYCMCNKKNILFLTNRNALKEQVQNDIGVNSKITVLNYQKIEAFILNGTLDISNFNYIVMDEAHYFFTDSAFNCKTDLFFKRMLANNNICKILMTATPRTLTWYFKENNIKVNYLYELKPNYNYLDKVICFNTYESIDSIIEDIPKDEQILLFSSAKRALEIAQKYEGTFICSQYNKDKLWDKYIEPIKKKKEDGTEEIIPTENYLELQRIIETGTFNNHLLCTTTALDNGINIKENTPVKHIILDIFDRDIFVQCLGRKRVTRGEKINLYFYDWNDRKRLSGFKTKIKNTLEKADFLKENGEIEYTNKKFKSDISDGRIIDDIVENGQIHKVINECMYLKYKTDLIMIDSILKTNNTLKHIVSIALSIKDDDISEMEVTNIKLNLEQAFERAVGQRLYKEEQKELIEFVGLKDARGRLQKSIGQMNEYLKANKLPYIIISKVVKKEGKSKRVWIIDKLIIS